MTEDVKKELLELVQTYLVRGEICWIDISGWFRQIKGIDLTPSQWRSKYRSMTGLSHKARAEKRRNAKTDAKTIDNSAHDEKKVKIEVVQNFEPTELLKPLKNGCTIEQLSIKFSVLPHKIIFAIDKLKSDGLELREILTFAAAHNSLRI